MKKLDVLMAALVDKFNSYTLKRDLEELTLTVPSTELLKVALQLRDDTAFKFEMLMDVCGIDYLHYGLCEWETQSATTKGFERGVVPLDEYVTPPPQPIFRFAVVYHLLSISHNHRLRLKVYVEDESLRVPSISGIWNSANWSEREVFDLFGILFTEHPDLRRILDRVSRRL